MELRHHPIIDSPHTTEMSKYELKRAALGRLLDEGDASGLAEGDIFAQVAEELGLNLADCGDQEDIG